MGRLTGKSAVITGGAAGIGFAVARVFVSEGARVLIVDRAPIDVDRAIAQLTIGNGGIQSESRVAGVVGDVSVESDTREFIAAAIENFGRVDVLVNNAGIEGTIAPIIDTNLESFRGVLDVNVAGVLLGMKHALPVMYAQSSGSVINMGSIASFSGTAGLAAYVASKHAVVGLTKTAALEAAPHGVRVNSIHPSAVDTQMMRNLEASLSDDPRAMRDRMERLIPLGHYAEPRDIALLALFLASDDSVQITGSQYRIDGGRGAS